MSSSQRVHHVEEKSQKTSPWLKCAVGHEGSQTFKGHSFIIIIIIIIIVITSNLSEPWQEL